MASSSTQITLGELGITKFKDVTPDNLAKIDEVCERVRKDFMRGVPIKPVELFEYCRQIRWIVSLALFYREEVRHPEWYTNQVACGESQLP